MNYVVKNMVKNELVWKALISEESRYIHLIKLIIDAKVEDSNINISSTGGELASNVIDLKSDLYSKQAVRQASHAYHVLFRGAKDYVTVVNSEDHSINNRDGIITQFFPNMDYGRGKFLVRLSTKRTGQPTRFSGEKRYISPKNLVPNTRLKSGDHHLQTHHSVVIMTLVDTHPFVHTSFTITKEFLSMIESSLSGESPELRFIRPFVLATNDDIHLRKAFRDSLGLNQQLPSNARWTWFLQNDQIVFTSRQSRRHIQHVIRSIQANDAFIQDTSISQSTSEYRTCDGEICNESCSCCTVSEPLNIQDQILPEQQSMHLPSSLEEHLSQPDQIRFSFPFYTADSIIPYAATHLNELNMMRSRQQLLSEDEFMHGLKRYPIAITNKDAFSLYPHQNATPAVVDLWTSW